MISLLRRFILHCIPVLVLACISLQSGSYLFCSGDGLEFYVFSDTSEEKNSEGKQAKELDNEKDVKFFAFASMNLFGQIQHDLDYGFQAHLMDHYVEVISPPPEIS